jgi:26S proteasome regulatory subunit N2
MTVVPKIELRNKVLRLLVRLYSSDYFAITQCCVHLNDSHLATNLLRDLLESNDEDKILIAYQVAFDLVEMATQEFLTKVRDALGSRSEEKKEEGTSTGMEVDRPQGQGEPDSKNNVEIVRRILTGVDAVKLYLEFLYRNNHADLLILKKTKVCHPLALFFPRNCS